MNNAAVSLLKYLFLVLLGIYLRRGIIGSYGNIPFMFLTFFWFNIFPKHIRDPLPFENNYMERRSFARCSWQSPCI